MGIRATAYNGRMSFLLSGLVESTLQLGAGLGLERAALIAEAELDEAQLLNRDARLPLHHQVTIGRRIIAARPGVNLSMVLLRRLRPEVLGVLGYALRHCPDLAAALLTFIRYQGFMTDGLRWSRPQPTCLRIDACPELEALVHPVEAAVGLWVVLSRQLTGTRWQPREVWFRHTPLGSAEEHEALFGVRPRFGAPENRLRIPPAVLGLPIPGADLALRQPLLHLLERSLPVARSPDVVRRLRAELSARLPQGETDKGGLARALGMSPRTLSRRLRSAGTSYREVLEETRRALALSLLRDPALPIYELAFLLGYTEPSTFHRAFRRWTGDSPDAWRRALPADAP